MNDTFKKTEAERTIKGRVFILDGEAWLLTDEKKNLYRIEDEEFVEKCRQHIHEIQALATSLVVRHERTTDHSTGGFNYQAHSVAVCDVYVPVMTVDAPRETFWAKSPVLCALADQDIGQELKQ